VDEIDQFEKAYFLYTKWCIDDYCKRFKVKHFSIYFEHSVEGTIDRKSGPDEVQPCEQHSNEPGWLCLPLHPQLFSVEVGSGSFYVSAETYKHLQVGRSEAFKGFGPITGTPVL
jgi:hypothetical protein